MGEGEHSRGAFRLRTRIGKHKLSIMPVSKFDCGWSELNGEPTRLDCEHGDAAYLIQRVVFVTPDRLICSCQLTIGPTRASWH
jgi:hypothetical protein